MRIVFRRTSWWHFDYLSSSHLQSQEDDYQLFDSEDNYHSGSRKGLSPPTVFLKTTLTQMITLNKQYWYSWVQTIIDLMNVAGTCCSHQRIIPQEALTVPSEWQGQSFNTPELVPVRSGSAEWEHIEKRMRESLNQVQVLNIERVQNKWLYRKYAIQRSLLEDKNGK